MAEHQTHEPDPEELKRAQDMWDGFYQVSKWSTIFVCGSLVLLALIFVF